MWETQVQSLGWENPLEKEMATHSSTLTWKIPWMEEPGRLQSMGLQRVGHDWATSLSFQYTCIKLPGGSEGKASAHNAEDLCLIPGSGRFPWRRKWQPTPVFLPGESHGQRSLAGYSPQQLDTTSLSLYFIHASYFCLCPPEGAVS